VTGHALGASGAIEALTCALAVQRAALPPNLGLDVQDPEIPLADIVRSSRTWAPGYAISNSFGFGGHNTVLVVGPG
jgi:3-oxoacyl-[acyl-carrier-protein] synthase II